MALITADDNYIKGRNGSLGYDGQPSFAFANTIENAIVRAAGIRMYGLGTNYQGWVENLGFTGYTTANSYNVTLADPCNQTIQLLFILIGRTGNRHPCFMPPAQRSC
jgi:hypothetical protein